MFNPLCPFEERWLPAFKKKGVVAFVKQTYSRGKDLFDETDQPSYVLIHFEKMLAAQQYYDVVRNDPARELLKNDDQADLERIHELLSNAKVYAMLKVRDAENKARKVLDKKIRAFIEYKLNWRPARQDDVSFGLDVQFGEVYARLKCRSKEIKVKLEEIESPHYVL